MKRTVMAVAGIPLAACGLIFGQTLTNATLLKPQATDAWPTYNGDYSGRRYSSLKEINSTNVQALSLNWATRFTSSGAPAPTAGGGRGGGGAAAISIKATPLMVNGILYFSAPNNAWAVDARTGRELWHYSYPPSAGSTIGNRGMGMYGNWLFLEVPDSHLVSLDAATGKERWKVQIADPKLDYTSTAAPIVVGNHIIAGIGGDHMDNPGFIQSFDPETGALQWKLYTTPRKGEPGIETWPDEYAAAHSTGQTWIPGSYDPELNLYYFGTGNPNPVMAEQSRKGDNLYTCTILAINPDTGKIVWYYQPSPHDTHDWDATEAMVLIDGTIDGKPRKLLAHASRNGYYFLVDRTNGQHIVTTPLIDTINWTKGLNANGQPIPDPAKYPKPDGTLVSPASGGATNWQAPSFDPETGLFYVGVNKTYSMFYQTDTDDHPEGYGGVDSALGSDGAALLALDYATGKVKWKHDWPGGGGASHMLTTAGHLLFTSNGNNIIGFDPANGKILWHSTLFGSPSAGPITYLLDGKQHLLAIAGDSLYDFVVN
jgi:alcohol dehydrogenase (cytochrome c)